jgi:hypothetical protein
MWLPRIVMSDGTRFGICGSPPPNMNAWCPLSSVLFWMRYGPSPFVPPIACESPRLEWHSPSQLSTIAEFALLSATQRRRWSVELPCT